MGHVDLECPYCPKVGTSLGLHLLLKHPKEWNSVRNGTPHVCKECGDEFWFQSWLDSHMRVKHPPSVPKKLPYSCKDCGREFRFKSRFIIHCNSAHSSTRPYECSKCNKGFKQSWHLKTHIQQVHKNLCRDECRLCHKVFKTKGYLERHMARVHGADPTLVSDKESSNLLDQGSLLPEKLQKLES